MLTAGGPKTKGNKPSEWSEIANALDNIKVDIGDMYGDRKSDVMSIAGQTLFVLFSSLDSCQGDGTIINISSIQDPTQ